MNVPLSLYIHLPWCIKKCPYCDFNSHQLHSNLPQQEYILALLADLANDLPLVQGREIQSIFFGGGTPSLFSPHNIGGLLEQLAKRLNFARAIEITLEANPGTIEYHDFSEYSAAGVNRISLGVQSFNEQHLARLGRIHSYADIVKALDKINKATFKSFNIDLMHGLPEQTVAQALEDLRTGLAFCPPHISWYQLTIEPNTIFAKYPPHLPTDDITWQIQTDGEALLSQHGFTHYEVSAFAQSGHQAQHNLNYWQFGDYLGIGAGAHGKITDLHTNIVTRMWKTRNPKDYLQPNAQYLAGSKIIPSQELVGEYMLNRLRCFEPLTFAEFTSATNLPIDCILKTLALASDKQLLHIHNDVVHITEFGKRFLNDLACMFIS